MLDRRRFLISSGIGAGLLLDACKTRSGMTSSLREVNDTQTVVVRRRWVPGATDNFKTQYETAVAWLKANDAQTFPAEDPRSFLTWSRIVNIHQTSCKHGNSMIFPWHRLYLIYFEQACRYALQDPTFALPYWDWSQDRSVPEEFWTGSLYEWRKIKKFNANAAPPTDAQNEAYKAKTGFLESSDLKDAGLPDMMVAQDRIDKILASSEWWTIHGRDPITGIIQRGGFGGSLEKGPHDGVHNTIGGIMGDPFLSPTDPIFWLHHSNIDRLWASWQSRNPSNLVPPHGNSPLSSVLGDKTPWEDRDLLLNMRVGKDQPAASVGLAPEMPETSWTRQVPATMKVSDVLSTKALGYGYDSIAAPLPIKNLAIKAVKKTNLVSNVITGPSLLAGTSIAASFDLTAANVAEWVKRLKARQGLQVGVVLQDVDDLTDADLKSEVELRLFLSTAPDFAAQTIFFGSDADKAPGFAGHSYMFGHVHDRTDGRTDYFFEVSPALRKLLAAGGDTLKVVVVAANSLKPEQPVTVFPSSGAAKISLVFDSLSG